MNRKITAVICVIGLCFMIYPYEHVAAAMNVKECIENEDCADTNESPDAADKSEQDGETADDSGNDSLVFNLVKMVLALLLVLGLIYALLKILTKRSKRFQQVKGMENIGGVSVGPNKSVQMVRVGTKVFLVGVGENVELLEEITDEETKDDMLHRDDSENKQGATGFPAMFQQKMAGKQATSSTNDFKKLFTAELDKLKQTRRSLISRKKEKDDNHE